MSKNKKFKNKNNKTIKDNDIKSVKDRKDKKVKINKVFDLGNEIVNFINLHGVNNDNRYITGKVMKLISSRCGKNGYLKVYEIVGKDGNVYIVRDNCIYKLGEKISMNNTNIDKQVKKSVNKRIHNVRNQGKYGHAKHNGDKKNRPKI